MSIKSTATDDFSVVSPPRIATEIVTTHMIFNFESGEGFIRQVYRNAAGNGLKRRFLKVTGTKYSNVETQILSRLQALSDNIQANPALIDGVTVDEIDRSDYEDATR